VSINTDVDVDIQISENRLEKVTVYRNMYRCRHNHFLICTYLHICVRHTHTIEYKFPSIKTQGNGECTESHKGKNTNSEAHSPHVTNSGLMSSPLQALVIFPEKKNSENAYFPALPSGCGDHMNSREHVWLVRHVPRAQDCRRQWMSYEC
jgi:hypothetical protein